MVKKRLGLDPLDPHGDGTIREGDPMYQLLLNGPVHAVRSEEDPEEWTVHTDVPEFGRQVPQEFTDKLKEGTLVSDNYDHDHRSFFVPDDSPGPGFGQKLFGFFWIVLGLWMLGTAFDLWGNAGDDLNLGGQILYAVLAGFNFVLAWFSLSKEPRLGKRW